MLQAQRQTVNSCSGQTLTNYGFGGAELFDAGAPSLSSRAFRMMIRDQFSNDNDVLRF